MKDNLDQLVESYFAPKEEKLDTDALLGLIEAALSTPAPDRIDERAKRFSYTFSVPKLVPTEAWGDPSAQDREEINRVFSVIRGGTNMEARIADMNKFLTPETAQRRRSPNVILNMMMITEALQATLNDYNESAAGFVFEGFMAALTGGKQIAGRVRGTLPIEDFIAFSEIGEGDPVSLKLLSPDTDTHGSFTNLVDYLFVRGAEKITYLIAYKLTVGDQVERLQIFDFVIDRNNLVDVLLQSKNMGVLGTKKAANKLMIAIQNWDGAQGESLRDIASALSLMPGYTKKGMMYNMGRGGEAYTPPEDEVVPKDLSVSDRERFEKAKSLKADAERIKKLMGSYGRVTAYGKEKSKEERAKELEDYRAQLAAIDKQLQGLDSSLNESLFHEREKAMMKEELLLEGAGDTKSQWGISRTQMDNMSALINMRNYGELNLSQKNIDELIEIYSEILGEALQKLLDGTQELTQNIGRYYSESKRDRAMKANSRGQENTKEIVELLQEDPKYKKTSDTQ